MKRFSKIALTIAGVAVLGLGATGAFLYSGVYDISATDQHTPPVYWAMKLMMRRSIAMRADETATPDLSGAQTIEAGFRHYHARCLQCHGAPGIAPEAAALGMAPVPENLVPVGRTWSAAEIHWVVKHGIKMTGMPAWRYRLTEEEIWQVVAFVKERLPYVSAQQYGNMAAALTAPSQPASSAAQAPTQGNAGAGKRAMQQYACATCHTIPGVTGAKHNVGPPLAGIAIRGYIAGVAQNTPDNMVRWLMHPQRMSPLTAMPDLGVSETDARDMTAYLLILK